MAIGEDGYMGIMMKRVIVLLALAVVFSGCFFSEFQEVKVFAGGVKATPKELNLGKRIYREHCYACHGMDGGVMALHLRV